MRNVNYKRLSRSMNVPTTTNTERINYKYCGKQLDANYYYRLMHQDEVYHHPILKIAVIRTNKNKTIKFIDTVRAVQLKVFNDDYPYLVYEGKCYRCHQIVSESYANEIIPKGCDVHHINKNKNDYNFENLIILPRSIHEEIHKQDKKLEYLS